MRAIARAPGKLVLSGAYAVLEGAPAIVTAVDRYVLADASRPASFVTEEVREALTGPVQPVPLSLQGEGFQANRRKAGGEVSRIVAPSFDASTLRDAYDRKLGLGSSAAIVVASLAALELARNPGLDDAALAERVLRPALEAHRRAQGGGSGIDVVASTLGGTLRCVLEGEHGAPITATPFSLPPDLHITVFSSPDAASTSGMLRRVHALRESRPSEYRALLGALSQAARAAAKLVTAASFLEALAVQAQGLARLGEAAAIPIVTDSMAKLAVLAKSEGAVFMPSGAGGGDVVLWAALGPSSPAFLEAARRENFHPLPLRLGARGVHAALVDDAGQPI